MPATEFTARESRIDGLVILTLKQVGDDRGTVREFFRRSVFDGAGVGELGPFQQINVTETRRGAVRGMHAESMSKLVGVVAGEAFGAYVDMRTDSSTHGVVETVALVPGTQVLVPSGVGNGFQALVDGTQYLYGFDTEWQPGMAGTACNSLDPALAIPWPLPIDTDDRSQISEKDATAPLFAELKET